eukprot:scaffold108552_cov35-Prasinocladus_malaysianus.AAC.1
MTIEFELVSLNLNIAKVAILGVALIAKSVVTVYGILSRGCHDTYICMIAVSGLMYALATPWMEQITSTTRSEWVAAARDRLAQWTDGANS